MDEPFVITINHKGTARDFTAVLQVFGYTHRFNVNVDGTEVFFERDEEGRYRAIIPPGKETRNIDLALLQGIAVEIENILA